MACKQTVAQALLCRGMCINTHPPVWIRAAVFGLCVRASFRFWQFGFRSVIFQTSVATGSIYQLEPTLWFYRVLCVSLLMNASHHLIMFTSPCFHGLTSSNAFVYVYKMAGHKGIPLCFTGWPMTQEKHHVFTVMPVNNRAYLTPDMIHSNYPNWVIVCCKTVECCWVLMWASPSWTHLFWSWIEAACIGHEWFSFNAPPTHTHSPPHTPISAFCLTCFSKSMFTQAALLLVLTVSNRIV